MHSNDIFEDVRYRTNTTFISDLSDRKDIVRHELYRMDLTQYPERDVVEFFRYVFRGNYKKELRYFLDLE